MSEDLNYPKLFIVLDKTELRKILIELQGMSPAPSGDRQPVRHICNECSLIANLTSPPIAFEHQQAT
jgi:hypothetical protein